MTSRPGATRATSGSRTSAGSGRPRCSSRRRACRCASASPAPSSSPRRTSRRAASARSSCRARARPQLAELAAHGPDTRVAAEGEGREVALAPRPAWWPARRGRRRRARVLARWARRRALDARQRDRAMIPRAVLDAVVRARARRVPGGVLRLPHRAARRRGGRRRRAVHERGPSERGPVRDRRRGAARVREEPRRTAPGARRVPLAPQRPRLLLARPIARSRRRTPARSIRCSTSSSA